MGCGLSLGFFLHWVRASGVEQNEVEMPRAMKSLFQGVWCWQQLRKLLFPPFQSYLHAGFFSFDKISKTKRR